MQITAIIHARVAPSRFVFPGALSRWSLMLTERSQLGLLKVVRAKCCAVCLKTPVAMKLRGWVLNQALVASSGRVGATSR